MDSYLICRMIFTSAADRRRLRTSALKSPVPAGPEIRQSGLLNSCLQRRGHRRGTAALAFPGTTESGRRAQPLQLLTNDLSAAALIVRASIFCPCQRPRCADCRRPASTARAQQLRRRNVAPSTAHSPRVAGLPRYWKTGLPQQRLAEPRQRAFGQCFSAAKPVACAVAAGKAFALKALTAAGARSIVATGEADRADCELDSIFAPEAPSSARRPKGRKRRRGSRS